MLAALILVATGALGADLLNGCIPHPKFPVGRACVYGQQCASGFCCPFHRVCLVRGNSIVSYDEMEKQNSPEIMAILNENKKMCNLTSMSFECTESGETQKPWPEWDPEQCNCTSDYLKMYYAERWANCDQSAYYANKMSLTSEKEAAHPAPNLEAFIALGAFISLTLTGILLCASAMVAVHNRHVSPRDQEMLLNDISA